MIFVFKMIYSLLPRPAAILPTKDLPSEKSHSSRLASSYHIFISFTHLSALGA